MSNLNEKTIQYLASKYNLEANKETFEDFLKEISEITSRVPRKERLMRDFLCLNGVNSWKDRVDNYNQVVKNVFRKTRLTTGDIVVPENATVIGLKDKTTGVMVPLSKLTVENFPVVNDQTLVLFSYPTAIMKSSIRYKAGIPALHVKTVSVPLTMFRNDPIGVAKYARETIMMDQREYVKNNLEESTKKVEELKKQLKRMEELVDEGSNFIKKMDAKTAAKSNAKLAKQRNSEKAEASVSA